MGRTRSSGSWPIRSTRSSATCACPTSAAARCITGWPSRTRKRPQRIIFATGDTVRGDTLHFLEALGRPYLHKPFTLAELRHMLGRVVAQPH